MIKKADAFIALPGGFGTMDELTEVVDGYQIGLHTKPIGVLNVNNFYGGFLDWITNAIEEDFMYANGKDIVIADSDAVSLIDKMKLRSLEIPKPVDF